MNNPKYFIVFDDKSSDQVFDNFKSSNEEEVTCNELWKNWIDFTPNDPLAAEAKERISKFTKNDWKEMAKEAVEVTEALADLVKNNVPMDSMTAENAFNDLMNHMSRWFFTPTQTYLTHVAMLTGDKGSKLHRFFNKFHPGLSDYMHQAIFVNKFVSNLKPVNLSLIHI